MFQHVFDYFCLVFRFSAVSFGRWDFLWFCAGNWNHTLYRKVQSSDFSEICFQYKTKKLFHHDVYNKIMQEHFTGNFLHSSYVKGMEFTVIWLLSTFQILFDTISTFHDQKSLVMLKSVEWRKVWNMLSWSLIFMISENLHIIIQIWKVSAFNIYFLKGFPLESFVFNMKILRLQQPPSLKLSKSHSLNVIEWK